MVTRLYPISEHSLTRFSVLLLGPSSLPCCVQLDTSCVKNRSNTILRDVEQRHGNVSLKLRSTSAGMWLQSTQVT